ncbi:MAG: hypothetical protein HUK22_02710, partial [Thermoguttaceae bacterium]|nr:hypothetical protein [Thermoguttaceae bacterium]
MRLFSNRSVKQVINTVRGRQNAEGKRRGADAVGLTPRKLGMETLEDRQLLSVNPIGQSEYDQIREAYANLALPRTYTEINVIELTDLSAQSLQNAVDAAGRTAQDDLIILRATRDNYVVDLENTAIKIKIDSEKYGDLTIVGFGEVDPYVTTQNSNAFTVLSGNVTLEGMALYNTATTEYVGELAIGSRDANLTLGSSLVMVNQILKTSETGEQSWTWSINSAMTAEEMEELGVAVPNATPVTTPYRRVANIDLPPDADENAYNGIRNRVHATLRTQYDYFGYNPTRTIVTGNQIYDADAPGAAGWVGTVANMLAYTGWAQQAGFSETMTLDDGTV